MNISDCNLSFDNLPGSIHLSERGEQDVHGGWNSNSLVCNEKIRDGISFGITFDEDGITIRSSAYHIENEETKKAFHIILGFNPEWSDVKQLRDFLNLLLDWHLTEQKQEEP